MTLKPICSAPVTAARCDATQQLIAGSKGKAHTEGESEDDVPFMAQEERRPLHRARKTMQLQDVDARLRDMRCFT